MKGTRASISYVVSAILITSFVIHGFFVFGPEAVNADTNGPNYAGSVGTNAWVTPGGAVGTSETDCADSGNISSDLVGFWKNFGFSIPSDAVISGIQVQIKGSGDQTPSPAINIGKNEATLGTAKPITTFTNQACGLGMTTHSFGNSSDMWGLSWTAADINAADFTVRINHGISQSRERINWIMVTVSYTILSGSGSPSPSSPSRPRVGNITVTKKVINDNGGTKTVADFPLFVNGEPVTSGVTNAFPAPAPRYDVTETSDPNYTRAFSGDCDANGGIGLIGGDNKFCIITNDDKATPFAFSNIDYNNDKKVDISDWSIFLSSWSSSDKTIRDRDDLNEDGKLDVSDFSIFLVLFQLGSKL